MGRGVKELGGRKQSTFDRKVDGTGEGEWMESYGKIDEGQA
jgi:hypothetical protein